MDKNIVKINANLVEEYRHSRRQNIIYSMASLSDVCNPNCLRYKSVNRTSGFKRITSALRGDFENVGQFIRKATRELQTR